MKTNVRAAHREIHPRPEVAADPAPRAAANATEAPPPDLPEAVCRFELRSRCALQPAGAQRVFLVSCAIVLSVAVAAAAIGAWPALVFAGIELFLLRAALSYSLRQGGTRQIVEVDERQVRVRDKPCELTAPRVFPRHWTRVRLQLSASMLGRSRLFLDCSGKHCEVGAFLSDTARRVLAQRLADLIGGMGESPPLPPLIPSDADGGYEHIG